MRPGTQAYRGGVKVILFGATGMLGGGVLLECLEDPRVESVLSVSRKPSGISHAKLREMVRSDFFGFADVKDAFRGYDACFFTLGVSAVGMTEEEYVHMTYDLTIAAADALAAASPGMTFIYVSGASTDSTEKGRVMWARVKGRTENRLLAMPFKAYMFRPFYIQPMKGVRASSRVYRWFYNVMAPFYPLIRLVAPRFVSTTVNVGRAMIAVAANGYEKRHVENDDINRLAAR